MRETVSEQKLVQKFISALASLPLQERLNRLPDLIKAFVKRNLASISNWNPKDAQIFLRGAIEGLVGIIQRGILEEMEQTSQPVESYEQVSRNLEVLEACLLGYPDLFTPEQAKAAATRLKIALGFEA